jgi:hypothetical protein
MSQVRQAEKKGKNKAFWPLIGFLLALAAGILAWFLRDPVYDLLARSPAIPNFPPPGIAPAQMKLLVAVALFTIILGLAGLIIALAAPRNPVWVKEKDLMKERSRVVKEKELKKARQREINRQMKSGK